MIVDDEDMKSFENSFVAVVVVVVPADWLLFSVEMCVEDDDDEYDIVVNCCDFNVVIIEDEKLIVL